jgi:thiamine-phosphate pyrophosphorylase
MIASLSDHADRLNFRNHRGTHLPSLILVTDEKRLPDPLAAVTQLRAGDAVLLRHYGEPQRRDLAFALAARCRAARVLLIVALDLELARAVGADGIHFPQDTAPRAAHSAQAAGLLVTVAAHDAAAVVTAFRVGADAALVSPVFETASHPGAIPLGVVRFTALVRDSKVPIYALGGISARSVGRLRNSGAVGVAAVEAWNDRI